MVIEKIIVNKYKGIKNLEINLDEKFNIIYGENGKGKSSLVSFITSMLYGMPSNGRNGELGKRLPNIPFGESIASGSLYVKDNGINYLIQREFNIDHKLDKLLFVNLKSNESVKTNLSPGEYFLGFKEESFLKTNMINELSHRIGEKNNDEIISKLTNLLQSNDENISFTSALKLIEDKKKQITNIRKSGKLDLINKEIIDLEIKNNKAKKIHSKIKEFDSLEKNKTLELNKIKDDLEKSSNLILEYKTIYKEHDVFLKMLNDKNVLLNKLKNINLEIKESEINNFEKLFDEYKNLKIEEKNIETNIFNRKEKIKELRKELIFNDNENAIDKKCNNDYIYNVKLLEKEIEVLKNEYNALLNFKENNLESMNKFSLNDKKIKEITNINKKASLVSLIFILISCSLMFIINNNLNWVIKIFITLLLFTILFIYLKINNNKKEKLIDENKNLYKELLYKLNRNDASLNKLYLDYFLSINNTNDLDLLPEKENTIKLKEKHYIEYLKELGINSVDEIQNKIEIDKLSLNNNIDTANFSIKEKIAYIEKDIFSYNKNYEIAKKDIQVIKEKLLSYINKYSIYMSCVDYGNTVLTNEVSYNMVSNGNSFDDLVYKLINEIKYKLRFKNELINELKDLEINLNEYNLNENLQNFIVKNINKDSFLISDLEGVNNKLLYENNNLKDKFNLNSNELLKIKNDSALLKKDFVYPYEIESILIEKYESQKKLEKELVIMEKTIKYLNAAYKIVKSDFLPKMNNKAKIIINKLTNEKFSNIRVDNNFEIKVDIDSVSRDARLLSRGTLDLFYLGLRLALCVIIFSGKNCPLIFDDSFIHVDDTKIIHILNYLKNEFNDLLDAQLIIFTCHKRETEIINENIISI